MFSPGIAKYCLMKNSDVNDEPCISELREITILVSLESPKEAVSKMQAILK